MCKHEAARLTVTWTEVAVVAGAAVEVYQVQPDSLRIVLAGCPACGLERGVWTVAGNWRARWPGWLQARVQQLAQQSPTVRRAVQICAAGLVADV